MGAALFIIAVVALVGYWLWTTRTASGIAFQQRSDEAKAARIQVVSDRQARIVCPYCQTPGHVKVGQERRAKRKTATRILGAAVTMGGSLPVTGVSKKGTVTTLSCSNCGMKWDAPKAQP